jgi:uncharacterized SAM-binding protein YcdF (DUF218 family)
MLTIPSSNRAAAVSRLNDDKFSMSMKCESCDANLHRFHLHVGSGKHKKEDTMRTWKTAKGKLLFLLALLILVAGLAGFRNLGRWLLREDPLSPADVIFVLSGGMPPRAEEAAKVFRRGYAPEVWVSHPASPASILEELGIRYVGEEEYSREILVHEGVPETAVHVLPDPIVDTEQEVEEVAREMRRTGKTRVIIVTSPQHTRRVKALWKKLVGENPTLVVHAAHEDPFDADHWWRNTRDAFSVVRETLGLVNAWAGLPVRPHAN